MPEAGQIQASQAPTVLSPKRWPLVNTLSNRSNNFYKDARLVNAYAEHDKVTGLWQVEKRPGFGPAISQGGGRGQGMYNLPMFLGPTNSTFSTLQNASLIVAISNNQAVGSFYVYNSPVPFWTVTFNVNISQPNYQNAPTRAQFLAIPGSALTAPILLFGGAQTTLGYSASAYWMSTTGVAPTLGVLIPGVNGYPTNTVPGFVYLDGFVYVMDIYGNIWESSTQNQIVNWSGNYIAALSESDLAVQLARQLTYVVAIKQWSTQVFYDAGNTVGSSLSPLPGAVYNFGCLHADTFCDLDGVLFWVTQSKAGTCRVVKMENLEVKFVSTPSVERLLDIDVGDQWASMAYQHAGHYWYIITNVTDNVTMVYDIGQDLWMSWGDFQGNFYPMAARCLSPGGLEWHQQLSNGNVYPMDIDFVYPTDYGNIVPVDIYTPNFDDGVSRGKMLNQLLFKADQTPGSQLAVRSSDDDYQTWSNFRYVDLSIKEPLLNDEGTFYRRAYHFRHQAAVPFRISSVDLSMDRCVL